MEISAADANALLNISRRLMTQNKISERELCFMGESIKIMLATAERRDRSRERCPEIDPYTVG